MIDKDEAEYVRDEIRELVPTYKETDYPSITPEEVLFVYKYVSNGRDKGLAYQEVFGDTNLTRCRAGASKLLRKEAIGNAIEQMQSSIFDRALQILPLTLMKYITAQLDLDVSDYYDDSGNAKRLSDISKDKRKFIDNLTPTINNKTGEVIVNYDLPKKGNVLKMLLDLMRFQSLGGNDETASESVRMKEAREKRESVMNRIKGEAIENAKG